MKIAESVEISGFSAGSPLTAVAMETATTNERINLACREAYDMLVSAFCAHFIEQGVERERATEMATFVTATIEGSIILSRTAHSTEALRIVAEQLGDIFDPER